MAVTVEEVGNCATMKSQNSQLVKGLRGGELSSSSITSSSKFARWLAKLNGENS